jgi:penicillin amidase
MVVISEPYPLLGHNRDYAYGLTMFENDNDLKITKDAKAYKTPNGFMHTKYVKNN